MDRYEESEHVERIDRGPRVLLWLIPAATFVVGLALGAFLVGLGTDGDDQPVAAAPPTASPTPSPSDDGLTVTVPSACLELADRAQQVLPDYEAAADAVQRFDLQELGRMIDDVASNAGELESLARTCGDAATGARATG